MTAKVIFQTLGTVSSFVLAFISLRVTQNIQSIQSVSSPEDLLQYVLLACTITVMIITGFSYFNSRIEHDGLTSFLYACLGLAQFGLAPIGFVIAVMKIEFGQYWWAVLVGVILFIIWGKQQRVSQN